MSARARGIVCQAAADTQVGSVRTWLLQDPRGFWEKSAAGYLNATAAKAEALGLTTIQVDQEIADHVRLQALKTELTEAKARPRGRRR